MELCFQKDGYKFYKPFALFYMNEMQNQYEYFSLLTKSKCSELKKLGIKYINMNDINPKIAYELCDQMCKLVKTYGSTIDYFGTIQSLISLKTNEYFLKCGNIKEAARLARQEIEYEFRFNSHDIAYIKIGYKLRNDKINVILFNAQYMKKYGDLCSAMERTVEDEYNFPGENRPAAIVTHEVGHMLYLYLKGNGIINENKMNQLEEMHLEYKSGQKEKISTYYKPIDEFVAHSFAEGYHSTFPSKYGVFMKKFFDFRICEDKTFVN